MATTKKTTKSSATSVKSNNSNENIMKNNNIVTATVISNQSDETRVVCPRCGKEIAIPAKSHVACGMTIGKDSGLGTVVLPAADGKTQTETPASGSNPMADVLNAMSAMVSTMAGAQQTAGTASGKDAQTDAAVAKARAEEQRKAVTDMVAMLDKLKKENPTFAESIDRIKDQIGSQYVYVNSEKIVRRWIPSQFLHLMLRADKAEEYGIGRMETVHAIIKNMPLRYSWNVLLNDLNAQLKAEENHDSEAVTDRHRFWNADVAYWMADDYISQLKNRIADLQENHTHTCKGMEYIPLHTYLFNNGNGLFTGNDRYGRITKRPSDIQALIVSLNKHKEEIRNARGVKNIYIAVNEFFKMIKMTKFAACKVAPAFVETYKAAGAYYTAKDLIMFEGYRLYTEDGFLSERRTLQRLEDTIDEIIEGQGMDEDGYKAFGFLKQLLKDNFHDQNKMLAKWKAQSEARRAARKEAARR